MAMPDFAFFIASKVNIHLILLLRYMHGVGEECTREVSSYFLMFVCKQDIACDFDVSHNFICGLW